MQTVLIGATGLVGQLVLERLIQDPDVKKIVTISRRAPKQKSEKLESLLVKSLAELPQLRENELSQLGEKIQGEVFFNCLGTTIRDAGSKEAFRQVDEVAVLEFARLAQTAGAKVFVHVSAVGANTRSFFFYNQVKGSVEEQLKALGLKNLLIFRPGLLLGNRQQFRLGESMAIALVKVVGLVFDTKFGLATVAEKLADLMVERAKEEWRKPSTSAKVIEINPYEID